MFFKGYFKMLINSQQMLRTQKDQEYSRAYAHAREKFSEHLNSLEH